MTKKELFVQGAEKYGTPLYIFDTDQAAEQVRSFRRILGEEIGLSAGSWAKRSDCATP